MTIDHCNDEDAGFNIDDANYSVDDVGFSLYDIVFIPAGKGKTLSEVDVSFADVVPSLADKAKGVADKAKSPEDGTKRLADIAKSAAGKEITAAVGLFSLPEGIRRCRVCFSCLFIKTKNVGKLQIFLFCHPE